MGMLPYGAVLKIKCISSTKKGPIINNYSTSTDYNISNNSIGYGESYFLESSLTPVKMIYNVESVNGDLVEIDTNLECTYTKVGEKITQFTISNEKWFNNPYPSEEITINKKINQIKVETSNNVYNTPKFKVGTFNVTPAVTFSSTSFGFNTNTIITENSLFNVSYSTNYSFEENVNVKSNSYVTCSKNLIKETLESYKIGEQEVPIKNKDLTNKKLYFNNNEIQEVENLDVIYPITTSSSTLEEYLIVQKDKNNLCVQTSEYWSNTPTIYNIQPISSTVAISYYSSTSTYLRFTTSRVEIGEAIYVSYTTKENEEYVNEYLITSEYSPSQSIANISQMAKARPIVYKVQNKNKINSSTTDFNNKKLYFSSDVVEQDEIIKLEYNYKLTKKENYEIIKNNNESYIQLLDYWDDIIKIYDIQPTSTTVTISSYTSSSTYLRFATSNIKIGEAIYVSYTTKENEEYVNEYLITSEYSPSQSIANISQMAKARPIVYKTIKNENIQYKSETTDINNKIIYLNNNEVNNKKIVNVEYNYPSFIKENINIIKNNNSNYVVLSNSWISNLSNTIKVYKSVWVPINYSSINGRNIYYSNEELSTGQLILLKYEYLDTKEENNLIPIEVEEKTTYEGIATIENKKIIKCNDLNEHEVSYTQIGQRILVNNKYDGLNIKISYEKEKPFINLYCNNVKIECCFIGNSGFEGIRVNGDTLEVYSTDSGNSCFLSRYVDVSWNKDESNTLYFGESSNAQRWYGFYGNDGSGWKQIGYSEHHSDDPFVYNIPSLKSLNTNQYQIGYTINLAGEGKYAGSYPIVSGQYKYYDEEGFIYTNYNNGSNTLSNIEGLPTLTVNSIWGDSKAFYKIQGSNKYIPANSGVLISYEWYTVNYNQ